MFTSIYAAICSTATAHEQVLLYRKLDPNFPFWFSYFTDHISNYFYSVENKRLSHLFVYEIDKFTNVCPWRIKT